MKIKALIFSLFSLVAIFSFNCSEDRTRWLTSKTSYNDYNGNENENNLNYYSMPDSEDGDEVITRFVKTGEITISTKNIESTKKLVYRFVKECKGHIVSEDLKKNESDSYYRISLNVQAAFFDNFIQKIDSSELNIVSRSLSLVDVSMKYVDDSVRLANKKKLEKRYLDLLAKASDIKEILEIEEKLEEVRSDVEVKTTDMNLLQNQVSYSEFDIRIEKSQSNLPVVSSRFSMMINRSLSVGWDGILSAIYLLTTLWPIYILIALFYYPVRVILRRKRKDKTKSTQ